VRRAIPARAGLQLREQSVQRARGIACAEAKARELEAIAPTTCEHAGDAPVCGTGALGRSAAL
jgi:hypothetical protein